MPVVIQELHIKVEVDRQSAASEGDPWMPTKEDTPVLDARDAELARLATEEVEIAGGWGASSYQWAHHDVLH